MSCRSWTETHPQMLFIREVHTLLLLWGWNQRQCSHRVIIQRWAQYLRFIQAVYLIYLLIYLLINHCQHLKTFYHNIHACHATLQSDWSTHFNMLLMLRDDWRTCPPIRIPSPAPCRIQWQEPHMEWSGGKKSRLVRKFLIYSLSARCVMDVNVLVSCLFPVWFNSECFVSDMRAVF